MKLETLATKKTLADELIIEKPYLTASDAKAIVDIIFDSISNHLISKHPVEINGFGKFETVSVRKRSGINPSTGEKIIISARTKPKFIPSKVLKEAIDPEIWSRVDNKSKQKKIKIIAYVKRLQRKYKAHLSTPIIGVEFDIVERSNRDGSMKIRETRSDLLRRAHEVRHYYQAEKPHLTKNKLHKMTKNELLVFMISAVND